MSAKEGWDIISRSYQQKTKISLKDVRYGPISAGERTLAFCLKFASSIGSASVIRLFAHSSMEIH
jgi:hypothetical protein